MPPHIVQKYLNQSTFHTKVDLYCLVAELHVRHKGPWPYLGIDFFFSMVHDDSYQVMEIAMSDKKPSSVLFLLLHCRKKRLHIPVVEMSFASSLVVSHYDCFSPVG